MQICVTVNDNLFAVLEREKGESRSALVSELIREALVARGCQIEEVDDPEGLTLQGAAQRARVSNNTIRAAVRRGELPAKQEKFRYYIRENDLRTWMDGRA